ncbi:Sporulation initiation phosphotransferase B [compost metagenome]
MLESVQRTASATLGHHRHDWMNDLQILYGYIQLGKYDKLADCVERIKERMAAEGKIARLGIPSLVFYLQSFREVNGSVQLEVCIQENLHLDELLMAEDGEELAIAIMETIRAYQFSGRSSWGDILRLKLSIALDQNEVVVIFEREGTMGSTSTLMKLVEEWSSGKRVVAEQMDTELTSLKLRIACGN